MLDVSRVFGSREVKDFFQPEIINNSAFIFQGSATSQSKIGEEAETFDLQTNGKRRVLIVCTHFTKKF